MYSLRGLGPRIEVAADGHSPEASPQASAAWAAISLALPLLTNPSTIREEHTRGFAYVTSRMAYYVELEILILPSALGSSTCPVSEFKTTVLDLYERILEYQIRSVIRLHRSTMKNLARDAVNWDDWENTLKELKEVEALVERQSQQINTAAARQHLDGILQHSLQMRGLCEQALDTAREQLNVAQQHLDTSKSHLDVGQEQLRLASRLAARQLSDEESRCISLFRLADGQQPGYEWFKDSVEDHIEGTCQWFLRHTQFRDWLCGNSGILLVSADPGCGKCVLARFLVDHELPENLPKSSTVCYFFFKDGSQTTLCQALCALLHQLLSQRPGLVRYALPEWKKNADALIGLSSTLWTILKAAAADSAAGNIVLVLDALDECREEDINELVRYLTGPQAGTNQMKVLLLSRPYDRITAAFRGLSLRIPGEEEDESNQISAEINAVIKFRVNALSTRLGLQPSVSTSLEQKLLAVPHRTYLWVHLVFDFLASHHFKRTVKGLEAALSRLPTTVTEAYEQLLSRTKDKESLRTILHIIIAAEEPLTVQEMNVAASVTPECNSLDDLDLEEAEDFCRRLRELAGLFISIFGGKVYLLHQVRA